MKNKWQSLPKNYGMIAFMLELYFIFTLNILISNLFFIYQINEKINCHTSCNQYLNEFQYNPCTTAEKYSLWLILKKKKNFK